jgi:hypothetical protein
MVLHRIIDELDRLLMIVFGAYFFFAYRLSV